MFLENDCVRKSRNENFGFYFVNQSALILLHERSDKILKNLIKALKYLNTLESWFLIFQVLWLGTLVYLPLF